MSAVREAVRTVVGLLVDGRYDALEQHTSATRLTSAELEDAITSYGRTLVLPPDEAFESLDVVEVSGTVARTFSLRMPLWTTEEGRSDLELELTLREVMDGVYETEIDNLRVP